MNKNEFLKELENALKYKLSQEDINEIISDYTDIFNSGIADGKHEDDVSCEIGSPANIARTILDETKGTNISKNKVKEPKRQDVSLLAPMSKRLGAYVIDAFSTSLIIALVFFLTTFAFYFESTSIVNIKEEVSVNKQSESQMENYYKKVTHHYESYNKPDETVIELYKDKKRIFKGNVKEYRSFRSDNRIIEGEINEKETINHKPRTPIGITTSTFIFSIINIVTLFMILGISNFLTGLQIYFFKGFTLGKWIMKVRVQRIDREKISFWDAILRDAIIKCIGNAITSGILNVGSFIWGCATVEHKTAHDLAAKTKVVKVMR